MRCKICGAKLRKEGDICKNCYKEYCKEEALDNDKTEIFKIYRKYLPKYQLTRYIDAYIVFAIVSVALMSQHRVWLTLAVLIAFLIGIAISMLISKQIAVNTTCTFYESKVVHKYKDRKKTLAYSDLKNVTYYQNFFQKLFKLGDIQFRPESGTYLLSGFEIKNVPNIEENWAKIQEILGTDEEE